jgi:hypothetical protein
MDRDARRRERRHELSESEREIWNRKPGADVAHRGAEQQLQENDARGERCESADGNAGCLIASGMTSRRQLGDVKSAKLTTIQKNVWPRHACATETGAGSNNKTVRPPSSPCATTAPVAASPRRRTQRRGSRRHTQSVSSTVSIPTVAATMR